MNYFINFETNYTKSLLEVTDNLELRKRISHLSDDKLKILLSIKNNTTYPKIEYDGIDVVPILNRAKNEFCNLNDLLSYDNHWEILELNIEHPQIDITKNNMISIGIDDVLNDSNIIMDEIEIMEESPYKLLVKNKPSLRKKNGSHFLPLIDLKNSIYEIPKEIKKYNENKYKYKNLIKYIFAPEIIENNIIQDLDIIIKTLKEFENSLLESEEVKKEFIIFKEMHKIINPHLSLLYKNTQHPVLEDYKIEILNITRKVTENRKKSDSFNPAGTCFYKDRIELNMQSWIDSKKYGKVWQKSTLLSILFHELGHAIDFPFKQSQIIKNEKNIISISKADFFSSKYKLNKIVKRNYLNALKHSRIIKKRLNYYINPSIKYDKENKIIYNWKRAEKETFAESMSYLLKWFMVGFNKESTFIFQSKESRDRVMIQTLIKTIEYLLKNIKWEYIGIPKELITKRRVIIKQFLNKVKKFPTVLPLDKDKKRLRSARIETYKKPTRKSLTRI